jgi:sucrose phosphorylase
MTEPSAFDRVRDHLAFLYGAEQAADASERLHQRLDAFRAAHPELQHAPPPAERLTENDVILITYGDQVRAPEQPPLQTLAEVLDTTFERVVSDVHILPFYPYTSDDGFSVVDYSAVDPALGTWDDIARLGAHYRLMFDAVINHISAASAWFQAFLRGEPEAEARFITLDPATDLSSVTRPRTHPLLTPFETPHGIKHVWTTFSADQIDLNFANRDVLLAIIDVLLLYVAHGAALIRLDAIGYLWKEVGTRSIHLPQTHHAVQLFRAVLDMVAPGVLLITETNVPHADNISYFGDGANEAQLVYQFPLAPLVLNAFYSGSAAHLAGWAAMLATPSDTTTFFNFLASHDGIGVVPATGILSHAEVEDLVNQTLMRGGRVSYKTNPDGTQSPYELNITLFDALVEPDQHADPYPLFRFLTANAIMLALRGVPGVYIHSLVGSHNNLHGLAETGRARTINREKWQRAELEARMAEPHSHARAVFDRMTQLIRVRRNERAFHPNGAQRILMDNEALFTIVRATPEGDEQVVCVHNVSGAPQPFRLAAAEIGLAADETITDLLSGETFTMDNDILAVDVMPYQALWLKARA